MADHALTQRFAHLQKLLAFALHHLAHGNARGAAHHFSDFFCAHAGAQKLGLRLKRLLFGAFGFLELFLKFRKHGVLKLRQALVARLAAAGVHLAAHAIDLVAHVLFAQCLTLFGLPDLFQIGILARELLDFLFDRFQTLTACVVGFLLHRFALDLQLDQAAFELIERFGLGIDFHLHAAGGLVNQVDCLVGQEAVGDVAVRKFRCGHNGGVGNFHAVVRLVLFLQTAQNGDRILNTRLVDQHLLEATLKRRVLFDVLAVFV